MSNLISELMHRGDSTSAQQPRHYASEPNFNPLAGARDSEPKRRWRPWLIGLSYLALGGIILWQGWHLLPHDKDTVVTEQQIDAVPDAAPVAQAEQIRPIEQSSPVAEQGEPPTDLGLGTQDLPALNPVAPPEPTAEPEPQRETTPPSAQPIAESTASVPEAEPIDPPVESGSATADDTETASESGTAPEIARVDSTSLSSSNQSGSASFSNTRRNRELRDAQALYQAGDIDQALAQLGDWLRRDDHTDVRQYYARLLLRAEQPEVARYVLQPGYNLRELELRAYADFRADAFSDALRHYSELLRRSDTPQSEWYLWVAICHDNLNQTAQAVDMFETYLQQPTGQPDSLIQHARDRVAALTG